MKSMMNSYNAGNVQFYENLHRKYFDKAKGDGNALAEPPNLDKTDGSRSCSPVESPRSRASRSRSRSRGMRAASQKLLQGSKGASKSSAGMGFSKFKGGLASKDFDLSHTQGGQTVLGDDTHLFDLTEKSNTFFLSNMNSAERKAG